MNYAEAESLLKKCGQQQVLAHWPKLGKKDRESLLAQIATLDPKSLARCKKALAEGAVPPSQLAPFDIRLSDPAPVHFLPFRSSEPYSSEVKVV